MQRHGVQVGSTRFNVPRGMVGLDESPGEGIETDAMVRLRLSSLIQQVPLSSADVEHGPR